MKSLNVKLENCYGIRSLETQFDFSEQRVYAIYAANGVMKSSFAQTFGDISESVISSDRVFVERPSRREITSELGVELPSESVLVIRPYDETFGHSAKTSTLLVDAKLRKEYEDLHVEIDLVKTRLIQALKKQSGSKKDIEEEISSTFTKAGDSFYVALSRVKEEVMVQKDAPFADVPYDRIFDQRVLELLATKDFQIVIDEYVRRYNELLAASTYFKRGTFNYYNAATIAKNLADNGFFDAKHTVRLNAAVSREITNQGELEELIANEKEGISNDADLRRKFAEIEKLITKNQSVRDFHAYLSDHEDLLPELANIEHFREEIWKSYLRANVELYVELMEKRDDAEKRRGEIEKVAAGQRTQWEEVIDIFNSRFIVPFTLTATNRVSVILGEEPMLILGFIFDDGEESVEVKKDTLMKVLSAGEKKALYILNVIFEIEVRKKTHQETVFVVDDIADSFDYKNKYAIIQYLMEISEEENFFQIILTHNFDFFRIVESRFVRYDHCLMAYKRGTVLSFEQATGIKNIFVKDWKLNFYSDPKKRVASIPFMRNIVEYTKGDQDPSYAKLTSLLHWKSDSSSITEGELDSIYNFMFGEVGGWHQPNSSAIDGILTEAVKCLSAPEGANFENKIVLSIAIRIVTERFMIDQISDSGFLSSIRANQTSALFAEYSKAHQSDTQNLDTIRLVLLMTPENIHLNSFMYEPILDMSDDHLRSLFRKVQALV